MFRSPVRTFLAWSIFAAMGCSGLGGGCGCVEKIPGGFPADQRVNNAITAKVSQKGLDFIEKQVAQLVTAISANGLSFDVPCLTPDIEIPNPGIPLVPNPIGTVRVAVCDLDGDADCSRAESCTGSGTSSCASGIATCSAGRCAPATADNSAPTSPPMRACQARADIKKLDLTPTQPAPGGPVEVAVNLQLRVNTGRIPIGAGLPFGLGTLGCGVEFDSNKTNPTDLPVNVRLKLTVDPAFENVLAFDLVDVDVTQIVDLSDLSLTSGGGVVNDAICGFGDFLLSLQPLTQAIESLARGAIDTQVRNILDSFKCRACTSDRDCPATTTCQNDLCYKGNPSAHVCAPTLLGLEGRVGVGSFLSSFGGPPDALLDLYAVAGGKTGNNPDVKVENQGIVLGIMGGSQAAVRMPDGTVKAPSTAACVPVRQFATRPQPTPVSFDTEAAAPSLDGENLADYQIGLAVSDNFIDKAAFDAFQSGLLCINADASISTFLSSSLFNTFLPSLRLLTHGKDVPMLIALRPKQAPQVRIGKGSTKKVNGQDVPDDPLLTIELKETQLDFYAFVEERYARLFSLKTDINLPLSLKFDRTRNTVQPVLANLQTAVTNIDAQNSELLSENPQIVADLLSAIIGLVQPLLASVLAPIELPTLSGLKLVVREARGVVPFGSAAADGYQHLGLFANLELSGATPDTALVETQATLAGAFVPDLATLRADVSRQPRATLDVRGLGLTRIGFQGYEYAFRVDGGLWSPWTREQRFDVAVPVLMFPGRHLIEVVAREAGVPETEDATPAKVVFTVDYEAPAVRLVRDLETGLVRTEARDGVSRDDELRFRYRVAGRDWVAFAGPQAFALDELGQDPSLEVEVTDAAGHAARAYFGTPADQLGDPAAQVLESPVAAGGCAAAGAPALALAALAGLAVRRRRKA